MHVTHNQDFRDVTDMVKNAVQIRPQKVKLRLRPGKNKFAIFLYISGNAKNQLFFDNRI